MTESSSVFALPQELIHSLKSSYPCRDAQITALTTLVWPRAAPCRNLIIHGPESTGKTAITSELLSRLATDPSSNLRYAFVKSPECVTTRHLFERAVGSVADALDCQDVAALGRCETVAALTVALSQMIQKTPDDARFVLVFDAIDRQREAPPTLLPALARLSEVIPKLTTIFILTTPSPSILRISAPPQLYFPSYTKTDYVSILSLDPPPSLPNTTQDETTDLWARFAAAVHDSLTRPASQSLLSIRHACSALWPRFTAPVAAGTHKAREFSKLLVAARVYFQDESVLEPGLVMRAKTQPTTEPAQPPPSSIAETRSSKPDPGSTTPRSPAPAARTRKPPRGAAVGGTDLAALLPLTARLLLMSAYLASHNAPRHDQTIFSTWHSGTGRRRRGGGGAHLVQSTRGPRPKHRRIARKLLGPGVFVLERMVAIYLATRGEWTDLLHGSGSGGFPPRSSSSSGPDAGAGGGGIDADISMAIATLSSLRLLVRVGSASGAGAMSSGLGAGIGGAGGDLDRGGKWRVNVNWEVIRSVGRSMGVEVEEWLVE